MATQAKRKQRKLTEASIKYSGRPLKRLSSWLENTHIETQLDDLATLLKKMAVIEIINIFAGLTIILGLGSWFLGAGERREEQRLLREEELINMRLAIGNLQGDLSGALRTAIERLHRNEYSLSRMPLEGANLTWTDLSAADLTAAFLEGAFLEGTNLHAANLRKADLRRANLAWVNLSGANLHDANLSEADLRGANLAWANLEGANLTNILYDVDTIWPEGFTSPPSRDGYQAPTP